MRCRQRPALFRRANGRYSADNDHELCEQCHLGDRDRLRALKLIHRERTMSKTHMHGRIEREFRHRPPAGDQTTRYELIRDGARDLAHRLIDCCPESRELSIALTKLKECVMWANAGIAVNEAEPGAVRFAQPDTGSGHEL